MRRESRSRRSQYHRPGISAWIRQRRDRDGGDYMSPSVPVLKVRVGHRWWLKRYIWCVAFFCWITRSEPNMARVGYWVKRGTFLEQVR